MSARVESVFAPVLRDVERRLSLPIPERMRILRELEWDLEAFSGQLVSEGLPLEEAYRRALDALVPDPEALGELGQIHTPLYVKFTRHLSPRRLRIVERSVLGGLTALVILGQALTLLRADLLRNPSPFLYPVMGLGALLLWMVLAKGFQLWVKRDHANPGQGLRGILSASGLVLSLGIAGTIFDFYRLTATLEKAPELAETLTPVWLVKDAALLSVAMIVSLAGGLAWFALSQWLTLVSEARRELLGVSPGDSP